MRIHFVGIGGIGMSSLAIHRHFLGDSVSGSDLFEGERVGYLRRLGIEVFIGHSTDNLKDPDLLVVSKAVSDDNPEVSESRRLGIPVVSREEFLRENLENLGKKFAVTGTDGKTTTTAMLFHSLRKLGENPYAFLGGISPDLNHGNYNLGREKVVFELDESTPNMVIYDPDHLIITNSRGDHIENFGDIESYEKAFWELVDKTSGVVVTYAEDSITGNLGDVRFGIESGDFEFVEREVRGMEQVFTFKRGGKYKKVKLSVPGFHNCLNALAVIALLTTIGYPEDAVLESFSDFPGVHRRFTVKHSDGDIAVIDDYAHTPDEIEFLIETAREVFPGKRVIAVFQPHRHTRLSRENGKFSRALSKADFVYVTPVYGAFEEGKSADPSEVVYGLERFGVTSKMIADPKEIEVFENSVYLFIGAGDIVEYSKSFVGALGGSG